MRHELLTVKGIGEAMLKKLADNHIYTIHDVIHYLPSRYEKHHISSIHGVNPGDTITIKAVITEQPILQYIRKKLTKLTIMATSENFSFKIIIFNREFLKQSLYTGTEIAVTGKFESNKKTMTASEIVLARNYVEGIIPIYNLDNISDKIYSKIVKECLNQSSLFIDDSLPSNIIKNRGMLSYNETLNKAHQPMDEEDISLISYRIKYEELFRFGLRIALLKRINESYYVTPKTYDLVKVKELIASLPFELTKDQKEVTNDIFRDLKKNHPMVRLLQGDVGSGKTVCATIASFAVITGGEQVAIMAPTEILAYQHYQYLTETLSPFSVSVSFLTSSIKKEERLRILKGLETGTIDLIVGTHSLIQDEINYHKLGFIVIDEQHRFGVEQRKKLRLKGHNPDVLLMSATPIPRTLSITIFGDMDISIIQTLPAGRKQIQTIVSDFSYIDSVIQRVICELEQNNQAYFIVPVIEGRSTSDLIGVQELYDILIQHIPNQFKIEILHGKLKNEDKTSILDNFYNGEINVLISTTVVEVGLNAPKATVMTVINAERFGLSQLHQLRGRVGRNKLQSYCYFLSDSILLGNNRLEILEKTNDGFEISKEDLRQRGPGEVFGSEQTGIPKFRMANIIEDESLLDIAFEDAKNNLDSQDLKMITLVKNTLSSIENYHLD